MRRVSLFVISAFCASAALAEPATRQDVMNLVETAISSGEGAPAQLLLDRYLKDGRRDPRVVELEALAAFYSGEYDRAAKAIEVLKEIGGPLDEELVVMEHLAASTRDATADFVHVSDGRFVVSHAPGPDRLLVPYALETLKAVEQALSTELGITMKSPVRLEIYPNAESLAKVSTLSVDAIRRTGTIALCKWGRLMIASPRALLRGYPWLDTIAHEYVHLVITKRTGDRAPVWLQEGLAKFLETRWRRHAPDLELEPAAERVLLEAAKARELLGFNQLHPSIALLPSQRDAALAFAQVSSFMADFHASYGSAGIQKALELVAEGMDAKRALAKVADVSFGKLESAWKRRISKRKLVPRARLLPTLLREESSELDEVSGVEIERARRFLRLGDMLWSRARPRAAAKEYAKAHRAAPDDPVVASRLARSAIQSGHPEEAVEPLQNVVRLYPSHAPAYSALARAQQQLNQPRAAVEAARGAIRLSPFDPEPHCVLAAAREENREQEARFCTELGGTLP